MRSGEVRWGKDFNIKAISNVSTSKQRTTLGTHSLTLKRNSSLPWKAQDQRTNQWLSGHVSRATFASICGLG
jgi:hypothetical protein